MNIGKVDLQRVESSDEAYGLYLSHMQTTVGSLTGTVISSQNDAYGLYAYQKTLDVGQVHNLTVVSEDKNAYGIYLSDMESAQIGDISLTVMGDNAQGCQATFPMPPKTTFRETPLRNS